MDFITAALAALDEHSLAAVVGYVAVHVACAVLFLPCSPLTFLAGAAWGIWPGLAISSGSALLGAAATFAIGRSVSRGASPGFHLLSPFIRRASGIARRVLGTEWPAVALIQGNPLVPASSTGYVFGLTGMRMSTFLKAHYLVTLPLQAVLVASGAMVYDVVVLQQVRDYVALSMIVAIGLAGMWLLVRRRLRGAARATGSTSGEDNGSAH